MQPAHKYFFGSLSITLDAKRLSKRSVQGIRQADLDLLYVAGLGWNMLYLQVCIQDSARCCSLESIV